MLEDALGTKRRVGGELQIGACLAEHLRLRGDAEQPFGLGDQRLAKIERSRSSSLASGSNPAQVRAGLLTGRNWADFCLSAYKGRMGQADSITLGRERFPLPRLVAQGMTNIWPRLDEGQHIVVQDARRPKFRLSYWRTWPAIRFTTDSARQVPELR